MLLDGVTITIVGMAIVFVFLVILVLAMNGLFRTVKRLWPASLIEKPPSVPEIGSDAYAKIAAAVTAAKAKSLEQGI